MLVSFAKEGKVPVVGLNYKDQPADAKNWLVKFGDPYLLSAVDADGRVGINYGVYGVPETYVIDKAGIVRYAEVQEHPKDLPDFEAVKATLRAL